LSVYFVTALANGLTGWVAETQGRVRGRRMAMALLAHTVVGVVGLVAMAVFLPMVSTLLFGARLSVDHLASFFLGVAFLASSVGNSLGRHVLIPEGATRGVFFSTMAGAAVGIPLSVIMSVEWGAAGATAALGISQIVPCVLVARRSFRVVRGLRRTETGPEVAADSAEAETTEPRD
jgi:PST family polysaccharide transporter